MINEQSSSVSSSFSRSSETGERLFSHNAGDIILHTTLVAKGEDRKPALTRKLLLRANIYENEPIPAPYVPPIFILISYERTPYTRYAFHWETLGSTDGKKTIKQTDLVFKENKALVFEMLKAADCPPDAMQYSFLRFEHAGSLQSTFTEMFPTPDLRIGCLVRLVFDSLRKRNNALTFLRDNGATNSDLYAINVSSNNCMTTVTRYLEPLFRHALKIQNAWTTEPGTNDDDDGEAFEVNFHLMDFGDSEETEQDHENPIFFLGSSRRSASSRVRTVIRERTGRASPLTVHDVSRFYRHPIFGNRNGAALLQSLPVVYVRCERDFMCLSACTEFKEQKVIFHVYYVWKVDLVVRLGSISTETETHTVRTRCEFFENSTVAYTRMLDDAKSCFWKMDTNAYVRLVLNSQQDDERHARFVLPELAAKGQISAGKIALQSKIEGSRNGSDDSVDLFPNSITLDCSKLAENLDKRVSAFASAYDKNVRSAVAFANADGAANIQLGVLTARQRRVEDMLLRFKTERVAEFAFNTATEMFLGVLDMYGVTRSDGGLCVKYDPVANYAFVYTLINESVYTSSTTFADDLRDAVMKKNAIVGKENLIPPPMKDNGGGGVYYTREDSKICEFDIESAYPAIAGQFNVSPETTCVVSKTMFDRTEERLRGSLTLRDGGSFDLGRFLFIIPYAGSRRREADDENSVIVSLAPQVCKGFAGSVFKSLVFKRRTNDRTMSHFFKRLANRICGSMGQNGSDLFAPHCLAAVVSLCRTIVERMLDRLKQETKTLRIQTDGGLLQVNGKSGNLVVRVRQAFTDTVDDMVNGNNAEYGIPIESRTLRLNVRYVNTCFISKITDKFAIRYADDEKILKGHSAAVVPSAAAEDAVIGTVLDTLDYFDNSNAADLSCDVLLKTLIHDVRARLKNASDDSDDFYFLERIVPFENPREEKAVLDDIVYDQHCKFGDTVPVWPVVHFEGDNCFTGYVCSPGRLRKPVFVNKLFVMSKFINTWVLELCHFWCSDFDSERYQTLFYTNLSRISRDYANFTRRIPDNIKENQHDM